jgi:hypothetical protein
MTKHEVIDKIRKLLALSESPVENEAAVAAEKARELLSKYNLGMADLSITELKKRLEVTERVVEDKKVLQDWVQNLLAHVSEAFDCECVLNTKAGRKNRIIFIGSSEDSLVAVYIFQYLRQTLRTMARNNVKEFRKQHPEWTFMQLKRSYLEGATHRIGERLRAGAAVCHEEEKNVCSALIVVKTGEIKKYIEEKFRQPEQFGFRAETLNRDAFNLGYQDAADIPIRTAIES